MQKLLYRFFIGLYPIVIRLVSPFNSKARQWVNGRKNLFLKIEQSIIANDRIVWMHCSSLGEFEQGRPLLQQLKTTYPGHKLFVTFFSPSGYEVVKKNSGVDYVFYMPMDSKRNAKRFLDIVRPELIVFVKYEFWYHYLTEARTRNIFLVLVSGIFRKNQPFFQTYGNLHRSMLACFTHLFVQNEESLQLIESTGVKVPVSVTGDTRFDRVVEIANNFQSIPFFNNFCKNVPVIVAGSTWTEDDKELAHYANTNKSVRFIIAPHSIAASRLKECLQIYNHAILYSEAMQNANTGNHNTIIIDNIGMLSNLYKYATVGYVGGGFGADGVHNVLEAAVYGRPVVFGPVYEKYAEAIELIEAGGAITVKNTLQVEKAFNQLLSNTVFYDAACNASRQYVQSKRGSTEKIMAIIQEKRLLTN